ncbi:hypothetical protein IV203_031422 [Nitzschia inconspicua]|uniref:Aminoglycoside phosphotransferase domain-containing protein n=1 Tax=Nitzschia inconspicua TaxID=303405 RepID=A0A9K3LVB3_9STRA|nr:hypothetical protein IV203_031422 [Nitzschia inconspicua]
MEAELEVDKIAKLELAINGILSYCASHSVHDSLRTLPCELQRIHHAVNVEGNDKLKGDILNGFSNYTYRIYLEKDPEESAVFAKVALTYALWNPTAVFSLERCSNEKKMMEFFLDKFREQEEFETDSPVCQPYFMKDLSPEARLLCCRFEKKQEMWGEQFLNGTIDERLLDKAARFVATINSTNLEDVKIEFPVDYNDGIKEAYRAVCPIFKATFEKIAAQPITPQNKHFLDYTRNGGVEAFAAAIDQSKVEYENPDVLLHGDFHIMNCLVENMIKNGDEVSFGPNASIHVCDWDMSHVGTMGRDIGPFFPFPIVCAFYFAAEGKLDKATACIDAVWAIWKEYARIMAERSPLVNKFDDPSGFLLKLYRSCLGWCGIYGLGANVILRAQMNQLPYDRVSEEMNAFILASYCLINLKALEWGFLGKDRNPEFTVLELEKWFRDIIEEQIQFLAEKGAEEKS